VKKDDNKSRKLIFDEEGLKLLAKRLKEIRAEKGLSQEELAYRSEITKRGCRRKNLLIVLR
jgi:DNA-binding XRE family transcriptional regulator